MAELKTKITDVTVANERIYTEMARIGKFGKMEVRDVVEFVGTYTASIIRQGFMETVMLPYFGKFKPKVAKLQAAKRRLANWDNGRDIIIRAIKDRNYKDLRLEELKPQKDTDENL